MKDERMIGARRGDDGSGADPIVVRRVVTGVDFHESAWGGAIWAMRHFAPDARHDLVHVLEPFELPSALRGIGGRREESRERAEAEAIRRLDELAALAPGVQVERHLREGRPAAELVRFAAENGADVIVVGEQGPKRGVAALLGSTAERVLLHAPVPVAVTRKAKDAPPTRLLVAIDDSEPRRRVLAWCRHLLGRPDVGATVLNVVDRLVLVNELSSVEESGDIERLTSEATAAMGAWLEVAVQEADLPHDRVRARVKVGDPAYEIISEAARSEADLILIGTRGGDVAPTPMMGRIVNKVVRSAPCTVLVVGRQG